MTTSCMHSAFSHVQPTLLPTLQHCLSQSTTCFHVRFKLHFNDISVNQQIAAQSNLQSLTFLIPSAHFC